jgi:hypothetical protein
MYKNSSLKKNGVVLLYPQLRLEESYCFRFGFGFAALEVVKLVKSVDTTR